MADNKQIHELLVQTQQAYHPFYREHVLKWQNDNDIPVNWFALNAVKAVEPKALRIQDIHRQAPYVSIERQQERYDELVDLSCLDKSEGGSYRLTEHGDDVIQGFFRAAHLGMGNTEPLPVEDLNKLSKLLDRLVEATLQTAEPDEKPVLKASRWTDPGPDASPSIIVDQFVTDLLRFRDDAHLAAWHPLDVDGRTWETLTLVWREEASSAAELVERLPDRGYSIEHYSESLEELAARGWINSDEGVYRITEEGGRVREKAEDNTDRIYYRPWSNLDAGELEQLQDLLQRTNDSLNKMALEQFWPLAVEVAQAIFPVTRDVVQSAFDRHFEDAAIFLPMLMVIGNEPGTFSAETYSRRFPYVHKDQTEMKLEAGATEGYLASVGNGSYQVTEAGRSAVSTVNDVFYSRLGQVDPLADGEAAELADLLHRIVDASLTAEEPSEKWALLNMHNCHPDLEYAPLARIDQHLDDLNAFRDDAHNAAWQAYDIDGKTRETTTFIWRGEGKSAGELAEKLSFRGYSTEDYAESISELTKMGWVTKSQPGFQLTASAKEIRQKIEDTTNRYFYAPWASLDDAQQFRLRDLFIRLKLGLNDLADSDDS